MKKNLILEICQNHLGSKRLLEEMIHAASESGVKHLKIQDIHSSELTKRERFEKGLVKNKKIISIQRPYKKEKKRLSKLDMSPDFIDNFISVCNKYKCYPIVTPFTYNSYSRLENKNLKFLKIASYDCSSTNFLSKMQDLKIPMIVSTGATKKNEIIKAKKELGKNLFAFLHCVTIYPTPLDKCNLLKIKFLKKFSNIVGWSDHTLFERDHHIASLASLLCGATYIERHFTILKKNKTKDGPVSINTSEAKELVEYMKLDKKELNKELSKMKPDWKICLGKGKTNLSNLEILNRDYYRGRFASNIDNKLIFNWQKLR